MSVKTSKSFSLLTTLALAASPLIGCGGEPMVSEEGVALELEALGQGLVHNGNDYLFITTPKTWLEARNDCLRAGYDLVTINDSEEEAFLQAQEQSHGLYSWWIGFNDRSTEGQGSWAGPASSTYRNFYPGEPNDSMGNEDCTTDRYSTPDGTIRSELWNDESCTKPLSFICERRTPTGMSGSFSYSASNTASATANTLNQTVSLVAGQLFQVGTCGVMGASGSGDTYLRLVDPSGTEIASNDDAGGNCGLLSTLSLRVPVTGTYTVRAGCFSSGSCSGTVAYTY
jgi:hypothetical protein